ncbi:uncharacterized protein MONBRDRAFT_38338 [Monosiga brevicollis MX1]|uniref:TATA-binding protein-associated factor 172 n=2 Tax=Monosiga brevicollis TaxID=81824 RepID=A9V735_MONBE|nr:uncharacterized protein MONBRDRAFT_38338 [Monosiga brevicollis MX1]EDQ86722.1 predicted protein [Monosiga brevicollis MX1]|eukprot:XP_001748558.1 hypothetical protein [Monosiga brevicollis MX1]
MPQFLQQALPLLSDTSNDIHRQGAAEAVALLVDTLDLQILPYAVLLVIPVMGRMSDFNADVRAVVARTFGRLLRILPLESGVQDPEEMAASLREEKQKHRTFIDQLMDPTKLENYRLPIKIKASLRSYQQAGIDWMNFLRKYQLHGILCDDMGLGKTLQAFEATGNPDSQHLPSLVVCPSTLTSHWYHEIEKFCEGLTPLRFVGTNASARRALWTQVPEADVVIVSYDVLRNDAEHFAEQRFNYCVLDEGHIIRNTSSKVTLAVKGVQSNHRLILSGTPIQNNVLELWSLFDFLMPGFLGTQRQFNEAYTKPIRASQGVRATNEQQADGALALEALHRQVLPFLLRRLKSEVLTELPPKIIQDYPCELTPVQTHLYEAYSQSQTRSLDSAVDAASSGHSSKQDSQHVFQSLQFLRKVCNHPALALKSGTALAERVLTEVASAHHQPRDYQLSGKLVALRQLLMECEIAGRSGDANADEADLARTAVGRHRALIFAQQRAFLDIVQEELLDKHLPEVTYRRLDGGVPAQQRHDIVVEFNEDPSIDVLLLTTSVGGLGLTLTGADTVIFLEHDWNPMKDLQAMDRAHRLGQTRVVNVYRLITQRTLEEKIMSLQRFKINVADTVVNAENASLSSMGTSQLLSLFKVDEGDSAGATGRADAREGSLTNLMTDVEDMWNQTDYEDFNVDAFMEGFS